ncbi:hypothetical protein Tco_0994353 [Tanacetum coccineum]
MVRPSQGDKGCVRPTWLRMSEKSRNRGGPREARRNMGVYTSYPRKDTFTPLIKTRKKILTMESVSFPEPPPLIETPEKQNLNKFCDYHGDRGLPPKQLAEWEPGKERCENHKHDKGRMKLSSEIMYEHCFRNLDINVLSRLKRCKALMIGFSRETYHPLGLISLRVTMGKEGRSKMVLMEFAIIKCYSPYNIIIGRAEIRSLGEVGSTIHSMIKFPTNQGVVTMETSKETLRECKHLERVQGLWNEVQWRQREEKLSRIREQAILKARSNSERRHGLGPVLLEKTRSKEDIEEVFTISHERPDQYVKMGATLKTNCKKLLADVLRENMERRHVAPEGRLELKEKVFHWLGEGLIRKVQHPEWITNVIPIMLANGTWKVQMDYSSLNKACSKDIQIRMVEDDEEKTRFHMEEGIYCFTYMPKELKNSAATLQRMMEKVLADQRGRNVEIHLEDIVIKSKSEQNLIQDVKETLRKLRRVNIKVDPTMSMFGLKEGKSLGHMVTVEEL